MSFNSILVRLDFETDELPDGEHPQNSFNSILVRLDFETLHKYPHKSI